MSTLLGSENSRPAQGHKSSWRLESDNVTVNCLLKVKDCPHYLDQRTADKPIDTSLLDRLNLTLWQWIVSWKTVHSTTVPGSENSTLAHGHKSSRWFKSDTVTVSVNCLLKDCPPCRDQRTADQPMDASPLDDLSLTLWQWIVSWKTVHPTRIREQQPGPQSQVLSV